MSFPTEMDQDALDAALDLVGRTGATSIEIGYLHDDVPVEEAGWYATAQYRGTKIIADNHRGPVEASEALARRLLTGGTCTHCHRSVTLSGSAFSTKKCRWTRQGSKWERGCGGHIGTEAR